MANPKPTSCPSCGSTAVLRCVYGHIEHGPPLAPDEVINGGDMLSGDEAAWCCRDCEHEWGRYREGVENV